MRFRLARRKLMIASLMAVIALSPEPARANTVSGVKQSAHDCISAASYNRTTALNRCQWAIEVYAAYANEVRRTSTNEDVIAASLRVVQAEISQVRTIIQSLRESEEQDRRAEERARSQAAERKLATERMRANRESELLAQRQALYPETRQKGQSYASTSEEKFLPHDDREELDPSSSKKIISYQKTSTGLLLTLTGVCQKGQGRVLLTQVITDQTGKPSARPTRLSSRSGTTTIGARIRIDENSIKEVQLGNPRFMNELSVAIISKNHIIKDQSDFSAGVLISPSDNWRLQVQVETTYGLATSRIPLWDNHLIDYLHSCQ